MQVFSVFLSFEIGVRVRALIFSMGKGPIIFRLGEQKEYCIGFTGIRNFFTLHWSYWFMD